MFYSHTFLARKGPLGTVWCAAHLQHKLRKSHYIATNIPSTVERIIDSEVPIALRMSGHLLLGVVRIYSKQVDYFQEDCNVVLITLNRVYSAATVNLPDDANRAPVNSITLPQNFNLDSMELDDYFKDGFEDTHLKSHKEITLTEQVPTGRDPYIVITFDEHELRSSSATENISGTGPIPMEQDISSPVEANRSAAFEDHPVQHNEFGVNERSIRESTPPSLEVMRDARHGFHFNGSPILPDRAEPDPFLEEQINNDKEAATPVRAEVELPDAHFSSSHRHQEQNSLEPLNSPIFSVPQSPQMELQPTPQQLPQMELQAHPPVAEPNARNRRRRQPFNYTTVLSNKDMKKALNDTSGLRRRKRNCPSSSLDIWKQSKRLKKDAVFHEPFITGSCVDLQNIHNEDFISSNPHLVTSITENAQGTNTAQPPLSGDNANIEIEVLRNTEQLPDGNMPSFSAAMPSPSGRSYFTPEKSNSGVQFENFETTERNEILNTTNFGESTATFGSDMGTSDTFHYGDDLNFEHTALSDIPETVASAGDLGFLEHDDHSPAESQGVAGFDFPSMNLGTPELHALSSRTRAVAQYLKKQSPLTPISGNTEETPGNLNLNKILEGKSRKICARMFYETLVLKNYNLIDVQQERPYDDVTLKVTPKLSKRDFS